MNRIGFFSVLMRPFGFLFGSGVGNIRVVKYVYEHLTCWLLPKQTVTLGVDGYRLAMDIGGDRGLDSLAGSLMFGGGYEVETTLLFKAVVKRGMNVVDVGAHVGYYTILASKIVGEHGKVVAFEPEPRNYEQLLKNIALNQVDNVIGMDKAAGAQDGMSQLFVSDISSGECSLVAVKGRPNRAIDVEVVALDSVVAQADVIKVDVDGGEMGVLLGMRRLIEKNNLKMFTEVWKHGLMSAGYTPSDYWHRLVEYGFKYIYLMDEREKMVRLASLDDVLEYLRKADGVNLLCSKEKVEIGFAGLIPKRAVQDMSKRVTKRIQVLCGLLKDDDIVLDVGCGTGEYITNILGHLPIHIVGIDCDERSIEYATARNPHSNVRYAVASGEGFDTTDRFNVAVCSHILEHNEEPLWVLKNVWRLVRDDGRLYVAVPNGFGDFELENFLPRMLSKVGWGRTLIERLRGDTVRDSLNMDDPHVQFFTLQRIKRILEQSGWEIIEHINEEFLGGVVTDRLMSQLPWVGGWNMWVADKVPSVMANSWMFICRKSH